MFYIFHGPDELSRTETMAELKAQMGDPSLADLNTTLLDGASLTLGELRQACDALPFLSDRRLVIVNNCLVKLGRGKGTELEALADYLPSMSDTDRLVYLENETLPQAHHILKLAEKHADGQVRAFGGPARGELNGWIVRRVERKGALIERPAADALAVA